MTHCQDLVVPKPTDPEELVQARLIIKEFTKIFITDGYKKCFQKKFKNLISIVKNKTYHCITGDDNPENIRNNC